jgi:hypothetical protein
MVLPATNYRCEPTSDEWCSADIGAPVLDARGRALGVLNGWTHDTSNIVTDLAKALAYMKAHTNLDAIQLAAGTEPFLSGLTKEIP